MLYIKHTGISHIVKIPQEMDFLNSMQSSQLNTRETNMRGDSIGR